jgi:hypothetical protein
MVLEAKQKVEKQLFFIIEKLTLFTGVFFHLKTTFTTTEPLFI